MSSSRSLLALAAGVVAGAALGLLFAPASGADTRKKMMKKGEKLRDQLSDLLEEGEAALTDAADKAKNAADKAKTEFGNRAQDAGARAASAANTAGAARN